MKGDVDAILLLIPWRIWLVIVLEQVFSFHLQKIFHTSISCVMFEVLVVMKNESFHVELHINLAVKVVLQRPYL